MYKREPPATEIRTASKVLVSVDEAAAMLSIGRTFVYALIMRNEIRSIKVGRTRRVLVSSLFDYVSQLIDQAS